VLQHHEAAHVGDATVCHTFLTVQVKVPHGGDAAQVGNNAVCCTLTPTNAEVVQRAEAAKEGATGVRHIN
jgi:hypothetical protein